MVAVVPVRAGSKGLPGKNVRPLAGQPLYRHAIDHGLDADVDMVIVTTDIEEIIDQDLGPRVLVQQRPEELCGDDVPMAPVVADALHRADIRDAEVILLQATSPLRTAADIESCLRVFRTGRYEVVMSVFSIDRSVLKCGIGVGTDFIPFRTSDDTFSNRQSLPPVFRPNGAVYVFDANWMREHQSFVTDSIGMYEMDQARSVDIDSLSEFEQCERDLASRERTTR